MVLTIYSVLIPDGRIAGALDIYYSIILSSFSSSSYCWSPIVGYPVFFLVQCFWLHSEDWSFSTIINVRLGTFYSGDLCFLVLGDSTFCLIISFPLFLPFLYLELLLTELIFPGLIFFDIWFWAIFLWYLIVPSVFWGIFLIL